MPFLDDFDVSDFISCVRDKNMFFFCLDIRDRLIPSQLFKNGLYLLMVFVLLFSLSPFLIFLLMSFT